MSNGKIEIESIETIPLGTEVIQPGLGVPDEMLGILIERFWGLERQLFILETRYRRLEDFVTEIRNILKKYGYTAERDNVHQSESRHNDTTAK